MQPLRFEQALAFLTRTQVSKGAPIPLRMRDILVMADAELITSAGLLQNEIPSFMEIVANRVLEEGQRVPVKISDVNVPVRGLVFFC